MVDPTMAARWAAGEHECLLDSMHPPLQDRKSDPHHSRDGNRDDDAGVERGRLGPNECEGSYEDRCDNRGQDAAKVDPFPDPLRSDATA